ncbi:MAG: hypothetical protein HN396_04550 [Gemmatimonadales bacterium]|jgi:hypothetical protein|nr:hypothetical protein [Gemmatimonadales bacterium]
MADDTGQVVDVPAIVEDVPAPMTMTLAFDPDEAVDRGSRASRSLMSVIEARRGKFLISIKGKDYMKFEAWQLVGMFYGVTAAVETVERYVADDGGKGFEAWAKVVNIQNPDAPPISRARAVCMFDEPSWKGWNTAERDNAVSSKAQTRALSKALRNIFAWVALLGGVEATPADEMEVESIRGPSAAPPPQTFKAPDPEENPFHREEASQPQEQPARQESRSNGKGNGGDDDKARRACFAIHTALSPRLTLQGVDAKMFWGYICDGVGVSSRQDITPDEWAELSATLRKCERSDAELKDFVARLKEKMDG